MSVRFIAATLMLALGISPAVAQTTQAITDTNSVSLEYSLGTPSEHASKLITPIDDDGVGDIDQAGTRLHLPEPRFLMQEQEVIRSPLVGSLAIFRDVPFANNQDDIQMGTTLSRGSATAGISFRYNGEEAALAQSDLFVDFALNDSIRVGIVGTLTSDGSEISEAGLLGVSAAYATESGNFLQGSISDAPASDPIFGLSIGLRF